jgi:hypothetical protein
MTTSPSHLARDPVGAKLRQNPIAFLGAILGGWMPTGLAFHRCQANLVEPSYSCGEGIAQLAPDTVGGIGIRAAVADGQQRTSSRDRYCRCILAARQLCQ